MDEPDTTRHTLILRLQQGSDDLAWSEFVEIYTPVIYRAARRQGLQDADAADVVQEVLRTVNRSIHGFSFQRNGSSFRGWLYTVTRSRLCDFHSRRKQDVVGSGDTAVNEQLAAEPNRDDFEQACEREYQTSVLRWAATQVRGHFTDETWQAFWQTNVEGKSTREVSKSLGMSEGAIYIARSRVLARMREKIRDVEDD